MTKAAHQIELVGGAQPTLERYGVVLEPFGASVWLVRSVPAMARSVNPAVLVTDLLKAQRKGEKGKVTFELSWREGGPGLSIVPEA